MNIDGYKRCECGNDKHFDIVDTGEDEHGKYTVYKCIECGDELPYYD